jgi:4-hydroxy-tetrahydrodipicolinate synthase
MTIGPMDPQRNLLTEELRIALSSPIPSLRTPFTIDGDVDWDGVRSQVDFVIAGGARTIMITWGDSLHSVLTDDEVAELARTVVEHTAGRAKVIAADNMWATPKAVAYAEYCAEIGADLLMLLPPNWAGSTTPDSLVTHFAACGVHLPTMVVTAYFNQGAVPPVSACMDLIKRLHAQVPSVVAIKDDLLGELGVQICSSVRPEWAVVSGGLMRNHTFQVPWGVDGYLSMFMSFRPDIAWKYFEAIESGNYHGAWETMRQIEGPLRDYMGKSPGGFNAIVHGLSELYGVSGRYLRPPYTTLTDAQMDDLAGVCKDLGIL